MENRLKETYDLFNAVQLMHKTGLIMTPDPHYPFEYKTDGGGSIIKMTREGVVVNRYFHFGEYSEYERNAKWRVLNHGHREDWPQGKQPQTGVPPLMTGAKDWIAQYDAANPVEFFASEDVEISFTDQAECEKYAVALCDALDKKVGVIQLRDTPIELVYHLVSAAFPKTDPKQGRQLVQFPVPASWTAPKPQFQQ